MNIKNKEYIENYKNVYKSHEPIYNEKYLRYPLNSFSSYAYLLPIYFINDYSNLNHIYGITVLFCMANISFLWWALSWKSIKTWDTDFILVTLTWLISVIWNNYKVNILSIFMLTITNDNIFKFFLYLLASIVVFSNYNVLSNILFISSVLIKFSDTFYGFKYGTAIFHLMSGSTIAYYFYSLELE